MYFLNYESLETSAINNKIKRLSNKGKPQEEFILSNIEEFKQSEKRKIMFKSQAYYKNDNDIKNRKRYYIDRQGVLREAVNLSNTKLQHPFLRKLVTQKVNYLLSKEFSIQCDDDLFSNHLTKYLDKNFMKRIKNVGRDSIVNGIAWIQVYYNSDGELRFKRIPSEEIIPFWEDADRTVLDAVLRVYTMTDYLPSGEKRDIEKIEYHTLEGVWYYVKDEKGIKLDEEMGGMKGHFSVLQDEKDETGKPVLDEEGKPVFNKIEAVWHKVPFVAFKYNADELSILKLVKSLIDDYDITTSDTSNNLQDIPNNIKVVKNYDGTDKEEFTQNLATFRTAFVSDDGDVKILESKTDIATVDSHLDRLRKDIYEAGNGVDTQEASMGNASGVALKFRYVDLDTDTDNMAIEYSVALEELIWFIKVDLLNKGKGDYMSTEYDIIFNTDNIINEHEVIEDAKNSIGIISDETIIANHPWVTDSQLEIERLQKEREKQFSEFDGLPEFEFEKEEDIEEGDD